MLVDRQGYNGEFGRSGLRQKSLRTFELRISGEIHYPKIEC
ncbi:hypothetical protein Poly41_31610 [Novipirellula artificiosorum]|uniref:Uncharacterized protein n=1 Tax=Novipirellula artificiosorum TaxID=2528016 RepID=A0A5C6DLH5_9BACT|nr:hypothetical protein Poly41_31610 [Novipirellula artificiosorum]